LDTNKAFAAYALVLIAGVGSVLTASVLAGVTSLPSPLGFVEHVALGLMVRAAYKSIGGFDWADWSITCEPAGEAIAGTGFLASSSGTASAGA
jgi:hypothetical protein